MTREWASNRGVPDRLYMEIEGLEEYDAQFLAREALGVARSLAPKLSGDSARNLTPIWGDGFFGIHWTDDHVWYQEIGIRPFTMRALAGKTIPMWIDDPTGKERQKYPKARTRITASGKQQVLIFRKVAAMGACKRVQRPAPGGGTQVMDVPASYPGAPGRIEKREARRPWTTEGRVGGTIRRHNIGVRWRHPGLARRSFIRQGLVVAASYHGLDVGPIRDTHGRYR